MTSHATVKHHRDVRTTDITNETDEGVDEVVARRHPACRDGGRVLGIGRASAYRAVKAARFRASVSAAALSSRRSGLSVGSAGRGRRHLARPVGGADGSGARTWASRFPSGAPTVSPVGRKVARGRRPHSPGQCRPPASSFNHLAQRPGQLQKGAIVNDTENQAPPGMDFSRCGEPAPYGGPPDPT